MAVIHEALEPNEPVGYIHVILSDGDVSLLRNYAFPTLPPGLLSIAIAYDLFPEPVKPATMDERKRYALGRVLDEGTNYSLALTLGRYRINPFSLITTHVGINPFSGKSRYVATREVKKARGVHSSKLGFWPTLTPTFLNFLGRKTAKETADFGDFVRSDSKIPQSLTNLGHRLLVSELLYRYGARSPYDAKDIVEDFTILDFESAVQRIIDDGMIRESESRTI